MSTNVVDHPSARRRPQQRSALDRELEMIATAARFAAAIKNGIITPEIKAQAEMYCTYGTPVTQFLGGKPLAEEIAS